MEFEGELKLLEVDYCVSQVSGNDTLCEQDALCEQDEMLAVDNSADVRINKYTNNAEG